MVRDFVMMNHVSVIATRGHILEEGIKRGNTVKERYLADEKIQKIEFY